MMNKSKILLLSATAVAVLSLTLLSFDGNTWPFGSRFNDSHNTKHQEAMDTNDVLVLIEYEKFFHGLSKDGKDEELSLFWSKFTSSDPMVRSRSAYFIARFYDFGPEQRRLLSDRNDSVVIQSLDRLINRPVEIPQQELKIFVDLMGSENSNIRRKSFFILIQNAHSVNEEDIINKITFLVKKYGNKDSLPIYSGDSIESPDVDAAKRLLLRISERLSRSKYEAIIVSPVKKR